MGENMRVFTLLQELGFKSNHYGYRYLKELLNMAVDKVKILPLKHLGYKCLAEKYNKSESCIEKDIQNAISSAWNEGNIDRLYSMFKNTIDTDKGKPTNKQFIMTILEELHFGD